MGSASFRTCAECRTASRESKMHLIGSVESGEWFCRDVAACAERASDRRASNVTREQIDEERRWDEQFNPNRKNGGYRE